MQRSELNAINTLAGITTAQSVVFISAELSANDATLNRIDTARLQNKLISLKAQGHIDDYQPVYGVYAGQHEKSFMVTVQRRQVVRLFNIARDFNQESILVLERLGDHGEGDVSGRLLFIDGSATVNLGLAVFTSRHDARINHSDAYSLFSSSYHAQLALVMVDESELGRFEDERYLAA